MSLLKKLVSHTAIYGASSIIGRLINWVLTPLYVNLFAPAEYGIFTDLYALSFYPLILLTFGMETTFFRYAKGGDKSSIEFVYNNAFWTVFAFALLFSLIFGLNYNNLATSLGYKTQPQLVLLLIGIIVVDVLSALPLAKLRYEEKAKNFAFISLSNIAITLILNIIFLLYLGWGIEYVFVANFIASVIRLLLLVEGNLPTHWLPDVKTLKPFLEYGFLIMLAGLAGAMNEMLSRNILPRLWTDGALYKGVSYTGLEINGIYGANYKLGMFIALLTQAFRYAVEPIYFKETTDKQHPTTFAQIFHYYTLVCLAFCLIISSFSYEIVSFKVFGRSLLTEKYWVGLNAVPLILLANMLLGMYLNLSFWFKITGQVRYGIFFTLSGTIITVVINFLTIPFFAYIGSAIASVLCYATMCYLCYYYGQKYYPVPYNLRRLGIYFLFFLALYFINRFMSYPNTTDLKYTFLKILICGFGIGFIYWIEKKRPLKVE